MPFSLIINSYPKTAYVSYPELLDWALQICLLFVFYL